MEEMYKIVVLVPRRPEVDLDTFFMAVGEAAYDVQEEHHADRKDWDIMVYGTPEKDDHHQCCPGMESYYASDV